MGLRLDTADDEIPAKQILTPSQQQRGRKKPSEPFFYWYLSLGVDRQSGKGRCVIRGVAAVAIS